jgi:hypothetical protein
MITEVEKHLAVDSAGLKDRDWLVDFQAGRSFTFADIIPKIKK